MDSAANVPQEEEGKERGGGNGERPVLTPRSVHLPLPPPCVFACSFSPSVWLSRSHSQRDTSVGRRGCQIRCKDRLNSTVHTAEKGANFVWSQGNDKTKAKSTRRCSETEHARRDAYVRPLHSTADKPHSPFSSAPPCPRPLSLFLNTRAHLGLETVQGRHMCAANDGRVAPVNAPKPLHEVRLHVVAVKVPAYRAQSKHQRVRCCRGGGGGGGSRGAVKSTGRWGCRGCLS